MSTCDGCRALADQVATLAALMAHHLREAERAGDDIGTGLEPSDMVAALVHAIREDDE